MKKLETGARTALVLRDIEDRQYQEIADALKVGLSAARMRIHRVRLLFSRHCCVYARKPGRAADPIRRKEVASYGSPSLEDMTLCWQTIWSLKITSRLSFQI